MTDSETLWLLFSAAFPITSEKKKKKNPYKQLESGPFFTKSKKAVWDFWPMGVHGQIGDLHPNVSWYRHHQTPTTLTD